MMAAYNSDHSQPVWLQAILIILGGGGGMFIIAVGLWASFNKPKPKPQPRRSAQCSSVRITK